MVAAQPTEIDLIDLYYADLAAYAKDNLVIRTKAAQLVPFEFNFAQRYVHDKLSAQLKETGRVRAIILKARQEGISTYAGARNYRRINLYENQNALVIADLRKRGSTLFKIYELFDRKLPDWLKPQKRYQRKGWTLHYDTPEGEGMNSMLTVETAMDTAAGRGDTIQSVHCSELAFWDNPEEPWTALMNAVPDMASEVIIESTANGVGNLFHTIWTDAEAGESSFIPIFLPWWIHEEYTVLLSTERQEKITETLTPWEKKAMEVGFEWESEFHTLTLGQVAWRRQTIKDKLNNDENLFKQEYPSTAREAFLVSGNCFFDEEILLEYEEQCVEPKRYSIGWKGAAVRRVEKFRGDLRMWKPPTLEGEYVIFADTATGKKSGTREGVYAANREQGGRDFSAAAVFDVKKQEYVACLHGRIPPEDFASQVAALGFFYSSPAPRRRSGRLPALLGVERNHSSGETVVRLLKDDIKYPNLYFDRTFNQRRNKMVPAAGWVTTESKRAILLDEFSAELRAQAVKVHDADLIRECFTFVRDDTGKAQAEEGCHDDRVIAYGGCIQMARHHHTAGVPLRRTPVRRGGTVGRIQYEEDQVAT